MSFFKGFTIALLLSSLFWWGFYEFAYNRGFQAGNRGYKFENTVPAFASEK